MTTIEFGIPLWRWFVAGFAMTAGGITAIALAITVASIAERIMA